ncbi:tail fiber assembly protein [Huaxiibacter chinensis]|uniref:tail fiber assembly protein n=1 Tax=Huaxiibacter chinensis TaxID=2899785 RepID=UPI003F9C869D
MNTYMYSAETNAFYPLSMQADYEKAGSWPEDGIEVSEDVFSEFTSMSHADKHREPGPDGLPMWVDNPAPTQEELVAIAEAEKRRLISMANANINVKQWPGKAAIGRLKGDELTQYNLWLDYLDSLQAVDTSLAPDINWPDPPED